MSRRVQLYLLAALVVVLVVVYLLNRNQVTGLPGVLAADGKFQPLSVQEPQLRLDLLANLQKLEYSGGHRDIFSFGPPPILPTQGGPGGPGSPNSRPVGPPAPLPPQPPQVNAQFFGYATTISSGKRVAFFTSGDEVIIVPEGDTLLKRFRLVRIGVDFADVEEISTGLHARLPILQPPGEAGSLP
ncbi:MAG: hypothetical protein WBP79_02030 [Candidatus Acidiferrales bacterium]